MLGSRAGRTRGGFPMRKVPAAVSVVGVLLAACAPEETEPAAEPGGASPAADQCASESLPLLTPDQLTLGTDNPAFPPWFGGGTPEGSPWEFNDPSTGKGYESAVTYAVAERLGFTGEQVEWVEVPFNQSFRPGPKDFDLFINQVSYTPQRDQAVDFSDSYYDVSQGLVAVAGTPIADATSVADVMPFKLGAPVGTTSFAVIEEQVQPDQDPAVFDTLNDAVQALKNGQVDGVVADVPTAFIIIAVRVDDGVIVGQFPAAGEQEFFGIGVEGRRGVAVALVSTAVVFTALALVVVNSPGWPEVRRSFLNVDVFRESFPEIARRFLLNVQAFLLAEVFILVFALFIAVLRSLPGAVFFPIRALAVAYTDLFRGIPTVLVIYILGFGAPALQLQGVPDSPFFWGVVALVLVYSAYVAEVYRAGIESVHPSQVASARSLGLSRWKALRFVVLPQAVRRVIPPLLNDFIGLQKDSALLALIGGVEALRQAAIIQSATFDFTPFVALALIYVVITIPQARFVDWLIARDLRQRQT